MNNEREIDMSKLFWAMLRCWPSIAGAAALGTVLMFLYTNLLVTPLYGATASVYISNKVDYDTNSESVDVADVYSSEALVPVYSSIVGTNTALEKVVKNSGLPYSAKQIASMLSTHQIEDTAVLELTVVNPYPEHCEILANEIATTAIGEITKFAPGSSAYIIDAAEAPKAPFYPSKKKNIFLGFVGGALIAAVLAMIREILDTKLKDDEEFSELIGAPILGKINVMGTDK